MDEEDMSEEPDPETVTCPECQGDGWIVVHSSLGEPEQQQCEYCRAEGTAP